MSIVFFFCHTHSHYSGSMAQLIVTLLARASQPLPTCAPSAAGPRLRVQPLLSCPPLQWAESRQRVGRQAGQLMWSWHACLWGWHKIMILLMYASLSLFLSHPLSLSLILSLSHLLSLSLSLSLSFSLCFCLSLSLSVFLFPSLPTVIFF